MGNSNLHSDFKNNRIRQLRIEKGLSQEQLSEEIALTQSIISCYETGKKSPSSSDLFILADYFDCSLDYLTGRSNLRFVPIDPSEEAEQHLLYYYRKLTKKNKGNAINIIKSLK